MPTHRHLLLIDPQNDFCDVPGASLPVAGADADLRRVAALLQAKIDDIDAITVTLDTHRRLDIAHPGFWITANGGGVAPFTQITAAQLRAGQFRPRVAGHLPRAQAYVEALEARGRYTLMVWPVHCELGSWGHNIHGPLQEALIGWQLARQRPIEFVLKGMNPWTEHYSALQAEVPDPADPGTLLNHALVERLDNCDELWIAGEASSHCVRATVADLVEHLPSGRLDKLVLISDGMSPVGGFEAQGANFLDAMRRRGLRLARCAELAA
ncbi:cysteine hydrolase [Roseateles violae]|uniref:Cysteine hydrolase n=1 Tax=Roseateles violae TaxID=3058042 RepID=A0ABT8DZW4_9BURK|nr:cysteine hydrolase [Pelomonas sp. PFR6]MDN3923132.1 cysteine hydrolase [Pelomonas sp. PFR6]